MKDYLFAWDIDNTLIYSKKHPHDGWKCVEWIHEKEQAYISPETEKLLRSVFLPEKFIPVTSRSMEQYRRIILPEGLMPECAVTANGADLLVHGVADPMWRKETERLISPYRPELTRMRETLVKRDCFIRCRMVDDAYLFVYCDERTDPVATAADIQTMTSTHVMVSGKKIYLFPPGLNKGTAIDMLRKRFAPDLVIAAGDSEMDIPMLERADICIHPGKMMLQTSEKSFGSPDGVLFSEFALSMVCRTLEDER